MNLKRQGCTARSAKRSGPVITVLAAVAVSGCSLALSGPDPHRPAGQYPDCDRTKGLVMLDVLDGAGLGLGAMAISGSSGQAAAVLGSAGALFLLAAYHGNGVVDDCRAETALIQAPAEQRRYVPDEDEAPRRAALERPLKPRTRAAASLAPPKRDDRETGPAARDHAVEPPAPVKPPAAAPQPPAAAAAPKRPAPPQIVKPPPAPPAPPVPPAPHTPESPWSAFWREVR